MNLPTLIGEPLPTLRRVDLVTEDHPDRPNSSGRGWWRSNGITRAIAFAALMIVAVLLISSVWLAIQGSLMIDWSGPAPYIWIIVASLISYVILTFVMENRPWAHEIAPRRALGLLKGLFLGAVLVAACVGVLAALGVYRVVDVGSYSPWMALLVTGLNAALVEEIAFRGVIFRLVEEPLGTWGAVAVSSVLFGVAHLSNADGSLTGAIAIIVGAGLILIAMYVLTRSLWWCVGFHFAWNIALGPIFGSVISGGGVRDSWLVPALEGPAILTGGAFGLEGSIICVALTGALGMSGLIYAYRKGIMVAPMWVRREKLGSKP